MLLKTGVTMLFKIYRRLLLKTGVTELSKIRFENLIKNIWSWAE